MLRSSATLSKIGITFLLCLFFQDNLFAHVKWFTDGSYADRPLSISEIINPIFLGLLALCLVVIGAGVWFDFKISTSPKYIQLDSWLAQHKAYSPLVMRVAAAMLFLLSWQSNAMLAPTLTVPENYLWVGWFQFVLAFLLLFTRTVPLAGLGIMVLFIIGNFVYHPFHMLDYSLFLGVGAFLLTCYHPKEKIRSAGLAALYITVGFSLCWVALEKFVYKDWSLYLLKEHPQLALGLNYEFFISSAAFVEFGLGYLLLVNLLQRPLAVIITIVFFLTTTVFGKTEIIGHTLVHGSLVVFLLEGPSPFYHRLTNWLKNLPKRITINSVAFLLFFFLMLFTYFQMADNKYTRKQKYLSQKPEHQHTQIELAGNPRNELPSVWMDIEKDMMSGYNLHFTLRNFRFTPENVNKGIMYNEGHAHLHINGQKVARIYSEYYHLPELDPGTYEITVTLNSNNHDDFVIRGVPIEDSKTIVVPEK